MSNRLVEEVFTARDEQTVLGDEGEEVFGLALGSAVEPTAAGEPGHGPLDNPAVTAEPL